MLDFSLIFTFSPASTSDWTILAHATKSLDAPGFTMFLEGGRGQSCSSFTLVHFLHPLASQPLPSFPVKPGPRFQECCFTAAALCARAAIMGLNLCWEANCSGELFTLQSPTRGRKRERERSKPLKFSSLLMRVASRTRCCISIGFSFRQSGSQLAYLAVGNICCCFPPHPYKARKGRLFA